MRRYQIRAMYHAMRKCSWISWHTLEFEKLTRIKMHEKKMCTPFALLLHIIICDGDGAMHALLRSLFFSSICSRVRLHFCDFGCHCASFSLAERFRQWHLHDQLNKWRWWWWRLGEKDRRRRKRARDFWKMRMTQNVRDKMKRIRFFFVSLFATKSVSNTVLVLVVDYLAAAVALLLFCCSSSSSFRFILSVFL